jgi:hypothetical protein
MEHTRNDPALHSELQIELLRAQAQGTAAKTKIPRSYLGVAAHRPGSHGWRKLETNA